MIAERKAQALAKLAEKQRLKEIQRQEEDMLAELDHSESIRSQDTESFKTPETSQEQSFSNSSAPANNPAEDSVPATVVDQDLPQVAAAAAAGIPHTVDLPDTLQY